VTTSPAVPRRRLKDPLAIIAIVVVIGVFVTTAVTWTAVTLDHRNENRLLAEQTRQAAALLSSTVLSLTGPLSTALQIEEATGGNPARFETFMSAYTQPGGPFVDASFWQLVGGSMTPVASVGVPPASQPTSSQSLAFISKALHTSTFIVRGIPAGEPTRIAYAVANPANPVYAVYAERVIPTDRRVPVESNSAFSDLDYATYLGSTTRTSQLATTDMALSQLPLTGYTVRQVLPFGDSTITLVARARSHLGDTLSADLPWIFVVGGALVTIVSALMAEQLVRRRRDAERAALVVADLYGAQRTIAETLQRALLPSSNPTIDALEIATRYVAGVDGVDVGGDWYSVIQIDEHRFAFAVGDVSGRGVSAASVMARLRFYVQAYLLEGHEPAAVLEMCSREFDITVDGHFSTVLVGIGDLAQRELTLANAGHLSPLILDDGRSSYVVMPVGLPLGVRPGPYASVSLHLEPGATFLAFTDGLVERRAENLDVGLERLSLAADAASADLEDMLSGILAELVPDGSPDDIAVLAFRWREARWTSSYSWR